MATVLVGILGQGIVMGQRLLAGLRELKNRKALHLVHVYGESKYFPAR